MPVRSARAPIVSCSDVWVVAGKLSASRTGGLKFKRPEGVPFSGTAQRGCFTTGIASTVRTHRRKYFDDVNDVFARSQCLRRKVRQYFRAQCAGVARACAARARTTTHIRTSDERARSATHGSGIRVLLISDVHHRGERYGNSARNSCPRRVERRTRHHFRAVPGGCVCNAGPGVGSAARRRPACRARETHAAAFDPHLSRMRAR